MANYYCCFTERKERPHPENDPICTPIYLKLHDAPCGASMTYRTSGEMMTPTPPDAARAANMVTHSRHTSVPLCLVKLSTW